MRFVVAFAVGIAVLWMHEHHTLEFWHVVKALVVGFFVLMFFRRK